MAPATKLALRAEILAARRAITPAVHEAEARLLCSHLAVADGALDGAGTVCAYLPVGTEPGSPAMLDQLLDLCERVLLPVARTGPDGEHLPLLWGHYQPGTLVTARWGLREPPPPWLPAEAVAEAAVILVPALAVARDGVRLGRGGGFYDRSLALCRPDARLVAVVRDAELRETLPGEAHDVRMTHALTPGLGFVELGSRRGEWRRPDGGFRT